MRACFLISTFCIFLSFSARALERQECLNEFAKCPISTPSKTVDIFKTVCESRRTELNCDQLERLASKVDQQKFFSCANPEDVCEQMTRQESAVLKPCYEGSKNFFIDTYEGIIGLPEALVKIFQRHPPSAKALQACSENLKDKIAFLGALRPKKMLDVAIKRMSCGEIRAFAQTKTDLILSQLQDRRLQEATLTGNDNLSIADMKLSQAEEQALLYDLKNSGKLRQARCFRVKEEIQTVCENMIKTVVSTSLKFGALSSIQKLTARVSVSNLSALKIDPEIAAETAVKKPLPLENQIDAIQMAKASPETLATENFQLTQAPRVDLSEFSKFESLSLSKFPGNHNLRIESATLNHEKVFLKVSHIKTSGAGELGMTYKQLQNEIAWTKRLSDLGWGPRFKGITVTQDGNYAIVTEYIEGQHLNIPTHLAFPKNLRGSQSLIQDLQKIKDLIRNQGIDVQGDLQIRVTEGQHAVIVDPEFVPARTLQPIEEAERAIDQTIRQIQNSH